MKGYPKWFTKTWIHLLFLCAFMTGSLLLPTLLVLKLELDFPWRLPAFWRDTVAISHVVMGFMLFALLGALSSIHMRNGFRKKMKIKTGLSIVIFIIFLAASGLGILYSGDEGLATIMGVGHFILGVLLVLGYGAHYFQSAK